MYLSYEATFPQHAELSMSLRMRRRHAEHESPQVPLHAEESLRTLKTGLRTDLRMRRLSSARGTRISACGDVTREVSRKTGLRTRNTGSAWSSAHGTRISACGDVPPHAEKDLRTRNTSLRMRKRFSARGT